MPNLKKLKEVAVFDIGDQCFTAQSGPWIVTGRYWSDRQQSIVYDLVFDRNHTTLKRIPEHELSTKDPRGGRLRHMPPPRWSE